MCAHMNTHAMSTTHWEPEIARPTPAPRNASAGAIDKNRVAGRGGQRAGWVGRLPAGTSRRIYGSACTASGAVGQLAEAVCDWAPELPRPTTNEETARDLETAAILPTTSKDGLFLNRGRVQRRGRTGPWYWWYTTPISGFALA